MAAASIRAVNCGQQTLIAHNQSPQQNWEPHLGSSSSSSSSSGTACSQGLKQLGAGSSRLESTRSTPIITSRIDNNNYHNNNSSKPFFVLRGFLRAHQVSASTSTESAGAMQLWCVDAVYTYNAMHAE
jgi:hypothetical protein